MQLVSLILIHWIVIYPVDSAIGFRNTYPLDIYPADNAIQLLKHWGLTICHKMVEAGLDPHYLHVKTLNKNVEHFFRNS